MKEVISILFLSILFIAPFLGVQNFFASPKSSGFISGDVFLFLLVLALPPKKILSRIPFFGGILVYILIADSIESNVWGLFCGILLLITFFANDCKKKLIISFVYYLVVVVFASGNFFFSTFSMSLKDVWLAASFYWWGIILFICTPLTVVVLNEMFLYRYVLKKNCFTSCKYAIILALSILGIHIGVNAIQHHLPVLEFSTKNSFWQLCTPGVISHSSLLNKDTKERFEIWDSQKSVFDYTIPTVFILIESWGVNQNTQYADLIIFGGKLYEKSVFSGIAQRKSSFTQGAEWEDFNKNENGKNLIPIKFKENGFETWFIHGYDGDFYNRKRDYGLMGFDSLKFKNDFLKRQMEQCRYGFTGICDSSIINWLDDVLLKGNKKFVYWTTLDSHPPYEGQCVDEMKSFCEQHSLSQTECVYLTRQSRTIRNIQWLAKKHPEYRFILKGDHRPMGSMQESGFVSSFYYKWVPLVILNR